MASIQGPTTALEIATLERKDRIAREIWAQKLCQDLADQLHLKMWVVAAELRCDGNRLTLYYHSEDYIEYKYLLAPVYQFYPMRILMSSFEPLSSYPLSTPYVPHNVLAKLNDARPLYHISSASAECSHSPTENDMSSSRSSIPDGPLGADTWAEQNMVERRLAVALSKNPRHAPNSSVNYNNHSLSSE
ncbi:polymerase suppressor [Elasticomyces elasticus]|nr:polymerase suppressor [Elasticomyces elasticus]